MIERTTMKFVVKNIETNQIQTKYGPKLKYRFTNSLDGKQYDAWKKNGINFVEGFAFEAELTGKPYKGIDTVQWPRAEGYGQSNPSNNAQLDRIEQKLDQLLHLLGAQKHKPEFKEPKDIPQMPYADSPFPRDEDHQE